MLGFNSLSASSLSSVGGKSYVKTTIKDQAGISPNEKIDREDGEILQERYTIYDVLVVLREWQFVYTSEESRWNKIQMPSSEWHEKKISKSSVWTNVQMPSSDWQNTNTYADTEWTGVNDTKDR